jgi:hypothetical protein
LQIQKTMLNTEHTRLLVLATRQPDVQLTFRDQIAAEGGKIAPTAEEE